MLTIEDIKKEIEPIAREYGVKKVYIFGSYAKGMQTKNSDVDLLIEKAPHMSLNQNILIFTKCKRRTANSRRYSIS